ncbi:hypothetical protein, partial [Actinomadura sp. 7K534]|uniref:hypothetical protein n=1 Tax=Actinomadura sp. 7K534 TaxID=2530366 RepID=UPI001A9E9A4B
MEPVIHRRGHRPQINGKPGKPRNTLNLVGKLGIPWKAPPPQLLDTLPGKRHTPGQPPGGHRDVPGVLQH